MLIYNKKLSVCPITTHLPLKSVTKNINKKSIFDKIFLIDKFYKKELASNLKLVFWVSIHIVKALASLKRMKKL